MVYDDTRWVRKLQAVGCWNEGAARVRAETGKQKKVDGLLGQPKGDTSSSGARELDQRKPSGQQASLEYQSEARHRDHANQKPLVDGFNSIALSPASVEHVPPARTSDNESVLKILDNVRSVRGFAMAEYGKVYVALRPYYRDAIRSKHPSNAKVFRVFRDPNQQAQMLSQMVRFSRSDLSQGSRSRDKSLSVMVKAFEDAVAKEYEQGLRIGDVDGRMRKYAHVLVTLNGGQRAVDRFVSENPILRDKQQYGNPMDCFSPNNPEALFLDESHSFFVQLSTACNSQVGIIDRVFPRTIDVVLPLLRRVGEDVISPYIDKVLSHARDSSSESFVRAVSGIFEQSLRLKETIRSSPVFETEQRGVFGTLVLELFAPHVTDYFHEEMEFFRRRSDAEVTGWERQLSQQDASIESLYMSGVNRQADKRDFLSSFRKVVMAPVNVLPTFSFGAKSTSARLPGEAHEGLSTRSSSKSPAPGNRDANKQIETRSSASLHEPPSTELAAKAAIMKSRLEGIKSLFSLEVALNLVHMAKSSIDRTAIFASASNDFQAEARTRCEAVFILLLKTLGERHVRAGFDQAVDHLSKYHPRGATDRNEQLGVTPLAVFLELVNVGDLIQQMLDVFYEQELVAAKLTDRNDFLSPILKEKKRFEQMLDERVAAGLNKGIEVLMTEVEYICATTQKVEDFNPGATGVAINGLVDVSPTNTAVWVVEVVSAHTHMLVGSTDKHMLDVFNQEVGLRLFNALCKHLKRQRISVAGSIRLIR